MFLASAARWPPARWRLRFRSLRRWPLSAFHLWLWLSLWRTHLRRRSSLLSLWLRSLRRRRWRHGARLRRHRRSDYLWSRLRLSLWPSRRRRRRLLHVPTLLLRSLHSSLAGLYRGGSIGLSVRFDLLLHGRALLLLGRRHLLALSLSLCSERLTYLFTLRSLCSRLLRSFISCWRSGVVRLH